MASTLQNELYRLAESAVVQAARTLRSDFDKLKAVEINTGKDVKSVADREAEEILITALQKTDIAILSEERGASDANCLDGPCWIIDPLDGTLNYTRGFYVCAVSVALWDDGKPQFGIIHDIANDRNYTGYSDGGAWCNGEPIRVSNVSETGQAVMATGFPAGRSYDAASLSTFVERIQNYKKIRMIGSAALSLANVAAGHFDIYREEDIWLWDVAAGLALVEAAGGKVNCSPVKQDWKLDVTAWNGKFESGCQ